MLSQRRYSNGIQWRCKQEARQFDSGSKNQSRKDLHLAISEEVPSQAQVKGSGNQSVGFLGEHYIVMQSLDVVMGLESQKVAQSVSRTNCIVYNSETNLARWEAPQEIATCCLSIPPAGCAFQV